MSVNRLLIVLCLQVAIASMLVESAPKDTSPKMHHPMFHNHISRKVLDRACSASKDAVDEVIDCFKNNVELAKVVKPTEAAACFTETFNAPFDHGDFEGHRQIICKNKDKFEDMTGCMFAKMFDNKEKAEADRITELIVDVGFCVVNALD